MNRKAFTLVELLIVIAIIAVLSGVVLVAINPTEMLRKSRDSKRLQDLDTIRTALELYATKNGSYPICNSDAMECSTWTTWWATNMTNEYLPTPPRDPENPDVNPLETGDCGNKPTYKDGGEDTGFCFGYFYWSLDGSSYELDTLLEADQTKMENDGGDQPSADGSIPRRVYEIGTNLNLINALAY